MIILKSVTYWDYLTKLLPVLFKFSPNLPPYSIIKIAADTLENGILALLWIDTLCLNTVSPVAKYETQTYQ